VQETYVRAFEQWHKKRIENPTAWLRSIAHNLLVSHYRKKKPASLEDLGWDPTSETVPTDSPEKAKWIQWGLAQLRKKDSHILEMFYFREFNTREIAEELHISERAVEGRLRRAREKLRKALVKCGGSQGGYLSGREA
jgi:RNA polymerase sigma-70 factor (ECF subfamily)